MSHDRQNLIASRNLIASASHHCERTAPTGRLLRGAVLALSILAMTPFWVDASPAPDGPRSEVWQFDRLDSIGGHAVTVLGNPRVIDTPIGKAVEFDGVDDALFLEVHPLAGAETFTWEVIFRPDSGGAQEQRFFHLQERDPNTGADTETRLLFETRLTATHWYLDSFANSGESKALIDRAKLHPLDAWYHAAMVYDGKEFRNYVNGELQNAAPVRLKPQGPGHSSAGVRINKVDYFKGAMHVSRMTHGALSPDQFLKIPQPR